MEYSDFQLRAWRSDDSHVQVLVHSSPAGDMTAPVAVPIKDDALARLADLDTILGEGEAGTYQRMIEAGRELTSVILPPPVHSLLESSLASLGQGGLRLRFAVDRELSRLPWEYIYAPKQRTSTLEGFYVLDSRISIVRGSPRLQVTRPSSAEPLRMLFVGALGTADRDPYDVKVEYRKLSKALQPVHDLLQLEFVKASSERLDLAFSSPAEIFHYAGHANEDNGRGFCVRRVEAGNTERIYADALKGLLATAGTRLAVLNACNSARLSVVEPLLNAGIAAMIGAHGDVWSNAAIAFCERLYSFLAVGLSLDQAVSSARQRLVDAEVGGPEHCEWGRFVLYLAASESVLFPQRPRAVVAPRRLVVQQHRHTMNRVWLRKAIMSSFSPDEMNLLCADVEELLRESGVNLRLGLEHFGGTELEAKVLGVIRHLDSRGHLDRLVDAVRRERPGVLEVYEAELKAASRVA